MKNIIVPTDFSSASKNALDTACVMAAIYGATVKVVHIYAGTFNINQPFVVRENLGQWEVLNDRLRQFAGGSEGDVAVKMPPIATEAIEGITETEIIHLSKDADTELIVMGTTGSHGISGNIFGTISTEVAKRAHCPVLLVPEEAPYFAGFDNILFATDYKSADEATLLQLMGFAERFDAAVHFVHVLEKGDDYDKIENAVFDKLFKDGEPKTAFTMTAIMAGSVAEGLNDYALENGIDLVVMVSQNRSFIVDMFHKSTTRALAFASTVPLMVLHQREPAKDEKLKVVQLDDLAGIQIAPFKVRQAVVGIERGETDEKLLEYLDFFSTNIPFSALEFAHFHKEIRLFSQIQRGMAIENGPVSYIGHWVENLKEKAFGHFPNASKMDTAFIVRRGEPLDGVLKEATYLNADLLAIGQKSNVESHGILSKNLARKAHCNVLVVPENAGLALDNILVPFDFSTYSVKALQTAVSIAKQMAWKPKITALNVFEYPLFGSRFTSASMGDHFKELVRDDRVQAFKEFIGKYLPDYEQFITTEFLEMDSGSPAQNILMFANRVHADLLVMGAKGHSSFERLLLGSVTEKVMSLNAKWPILVVK